MRILVIGASGLVGSHVLAEAIARGHEAVGTFRNYPIAGLIKLDLADGKSVEALLDSSKPDWVVHAAGWTWVDGCEREPQRAFIENLEQPSMLADDCRKRGCGFVYFSTTYVFDGTAGPYSEDDKPNPINVYAKSKWAAEQRIQDILGGRALIPRVICVWGNESQQKNFVYQAIRSLQDGSTMTLPSDQIGNPTWAGDIASWLLELMQRSESGVWNLAGDQENCTRIDWFCQIRESLLSRGLISDSIGQGYRGIDTKSLGQLALRPLNAGSRNKKRSAAGLFSRNIGDFYSLLVNKSEQV